jgi:predicted RND superfamily exporter protein
MSMKEPSHPIWSLSRLTVVMIALVSTLWLNASHFDETEIRTIITMFLVAAGAEGGVQFLSQFSKRREGSDD